VFFSPLFATVVSSPLCFRSSTTVEDDEGEEEEPGEESGILGEDPRRIHQENGVFWEGNLGEIVVLW
jgi:hypothetical protein